MAFEEDIAWYEKISIACAFGFILRICFLLYGTWHDSTFELKYTDIDYSVFTEAAVFVSKGSSPYLKTTYKYSPLLAWVLQPNVTMHPAFGKCLFCFLDLVTGWIMYWLLLCTNKEGSSASVAAKFHPTVFISFVWFWNPFIIIISTRGNAEAIQSFLVLTTLYFLMTEKWMMAGIFYGLSIHFKIYPVIFSASILLFLSCQSENAGQCNTFSLNIAKKIWQAVFQRKTWVFGLSAAVSLLLLNAWMFYLYGFDFVDSTFLFHVSRTDMKHNFSPYFYIIQKLLNTRWEKVVGALAFIPQATVTIWLGIVFHSQLPLAWFLQIFAFVSLNKVCTSQYFIWYLSLLPIALAYLRLTYAQGVKMVLYWAAAQAFWLFMAYLLEYQGLDTVLYVWMGSLLFLAVNTWILISFVRCAVSGLPNQREKQK